MKLSVPQASKHSGVTPRTIHRWIQAGKVEAKKINGQWSITADSLPDTVNDIAIDNSNDMVLTLSGQCQLLESQLSAKDEQIKKLQQAVEGLQQALDQSQQLQALTENRYQAEHQQLTEIKGRSLLQRLKAVLVANP